MLAPPFPRSVFKSKRSRAGGAAAKEKKGRGKRFRSRGGSGGAEFLSRRSDFLSSQGPGPGPGREKREQDTLLPLKLLWIINKLTHRQGDDPPLA